MFQSINFFVKPAMYPSSIPILTNITASFRGYRKTYFLHKDLTYIHLHLEIWTVRDGASKMTKHLVCIFASSNLIFSKGIEIAKCYAKVWLLFVL